MAATPQSPTIVLPDSTVLPPNAVIPELTVFGQYPESLPTLTIRRGTRPRVPGTAILLLLILLLFAVCAEAQYTDAPTIARAGANDLACRSGRAVGVNPAALGLERNRRTTFDFLSAHFSAGNNAYDIDFWNDQIARDHYLTVADKREILSRLSGDELEIYLSASTPLLGFTYQKMGGNVSLETATTARAPAELFELALFGNELDRAYKLEDFEGEEYSLLNVSLGFSYEFEQEWIPKLLAGVGFHFYQGTNYESIKTAEGNLHVTDSLITGYTVVQRVNSTRGDGVGFDLGGLAVLNDRWMAGLAVRQIGSRMSWDVDENELLTWEADSAGIIIDSLDDDNYLKRLYNSTDQSFPGGTIESTLPTIIELDARFEAEKRLSLMGTMLYRTETSAQGRSGVEGALAGELRPLNWLPVQAGLSLGGSPGWQVGAGTGLRFRHYELSLGASWSRGLFDEARGVSLGLSQQIRF